MFESFLAEAQAETFSGCFFSRYASRWQESKPPNQPIAHARLEPLGVQVVDTSESDHLAEVHNLIQREGSLVLTNHRFYIEARKPR